MEKFAVSGMSCAACVARVEKAVSKVPGVSSCTVSLLTNSMGVEGNANPNEIVEAVKNAGYGAKALGEKSSEKKSSNENENTNEEILKNTETPILVKRLVWSAGFLLVLMYVSMGHSMWGWPLPTWFLKNGGNHVAIGFVQMILAAVIMLINKKFFISGFKSLLHASPNMDTLVALGSGVSFIYSVFMLFGMTDALLAGDSEKVMHFMHNLYFESAAMILTLITVGKLLESISKGKTTDALKSLMKLSPKTANLIRDGKELEVGIEEVCVGDIFVVRPGENIPVDGVILEGTTAINESALTGESLPVDKNLGDEVSSATINLSGFIKCKASRVGKDTTLSQIIQMVSDAAATKAPIAKIADKVSGVFVPFVMGIAIITFVVWLLVGAEFSFALSRAICVLVVSCPCALGLATPVAIMVGNGIGAKNGILFKTSASLEQVGKTQIVILDKTGTITKGEPVVTDIISLETDEKTLIQKAASLEAKSEHPLAKAILQKAKDEQISILEVNDFIAVPGNGLSANIEGKKIYGGNLKYIESVVAPAVTEKSRSIETTWQAEALSDEGKTPLFFAEDGKLLGIIAVSDVLKDDSPKAIQELKNLGIYTIMLTGDNEKTAQAIAKKAGVDKVIAGVLPDGKEKVVQKYKKFGKVCMVGDGINDAPALTAADSGMAIGAGTDVAIDAADVVLMKNSLCDVTKAIRLSKKTLKNIHENLFWAFFYNIILIPLAAGVYYKWLGIDMNPMFGAAAMSLSSFCVVTNALRLNFFKINNSKHDKKIKRAVLDDTSAVTDIKNPVCDIKNVVTDIKDAVIEPVEITNKNTTKDSTDGFDVAQPPHENDNETAEYENDCGAVDYEIDNVGNNTQVVSRTSTTNNTKNNKEDKIMSTEKTLKVEGMMCPNCERHVKEALEKIDGVESAVANHEKAEVIVKLSKDVSDSEFEKAISDAGYTFVK